MSTITKAQRRLFEDEIHEAIRRDRDRGVRIEFLPAEENIQDNWEDDAFSPIAMWVMFSLGILVILVAAGI
ncbi:MAG: hypothetical protein O3B72_02910 [Proteobacteria bacterium]|nr:hypothetical protein [Pseudomonadota bacterium]